MSDLVTLLKARKRFVKRIPLRTQEGTLDVGLMALNDAEEAEADLATEKHFLPKKQEDIPSDDWHGERAVQVLCRAIVDPDKKPAEPCLTVGEVRTLLAGSEVGYLLREYNEYCDAVRPSFDNLTKEQYEAIIEEVKKKPDSTIVLGWHMLAALVSFLVAERKTSHPVSSSTTSD